jgi:hypothetical protein
MEATSSSETFIIINYCAQCLISKEQNIIMIIARTSHYMVVNRFIELQRRNIPAHGVMKKIYV